MNKKQNSLMRFSRTERLAQLSEQEIVIERKKREIQAKIEAQKKKETEEALKRLESAKETISNKFGSLKKSWTGSAYHRNKDNEKPVEPVKESLTNAFSNDGSFLDQFKKLSKSGLSFDNVDRQTLPFGRKQEDLKDKKNFQDPDTENEEKDSYSFLHKNVTMDYSSKSEKQSFYEGHQSADPDAKVQLCKTTLPNPSQERGGSIISSLNNPVPAVPSHLVQTPQFQATQSQVSMFNANDLKSHPSGYSGAAVPHFQVPGTSASDFKSHNVPVTSNFSSNLFPATSLSCIQPPLPITPQSIPPPSPIQVQNIPPPAKPPRDSELPKYRTESISLSLKPNVPKKLEAIPNPLEIHQPPSPQSPLNAPWEKKESLNSSLASKSQTFSSDTKKSLRISSAFYDEDEDEDNDCLNERCRHWAQLVARCGDQFEDSLRDRNPSDPNLRFLFNKNSKEYSLYRKLVLKYRKGELLESESSVERQQKSFKESSKDKIFSSTRNSDSDSYEERETPVQLTSYEPKETKNYQTDKEQSSRVFSENSKASEKMDVKDAARTNERRNRKRKSRWGDVVTNVGAPGVAGNVCVQPAGKVPAPKSSLLSQLTRSDPGLIQYARQTFGSTNLSEEDWKKAEDHYKINLLYQDMVKKRAEVEKLEKQGKFKYEYDSDEDTEGGTWEHKLRQQEMQATQLWAEELTRQAAGKHHIGDFLPPEELEKFMEKYNAVKEGREPDLSDYKEYKLKQDNVGYRLLQKMGWNEGQGLGQDGSGMQNPVNKATTRHENQGLGVERPDGLEAGDDEYDAYRKRMMLAYRFRPNPLNNPRRPYY